MDKFIQLSTGSTCTAEILKFAESNTNWLHKNAFDLVVVPFHILANDSIIKRISNEFNSTPVIFKMPPWQFYRFHTDAARGCALNLFLSGADSQTYYGEDTPDEEVVTITELNYQKDCYYLLNTQIKHAVINRNNVRYMFSLGINADYAAVRDFCLENHL